jgi:hypothetical protein
MEANVVTEKQGDAPEYPGDNPKSVFEIFMRW